MELNVYFEVFRLLKGIAIDRKTRQVYRTHAKLQ